MTATIKMQVLTTIVSLFDPLEYLTPTTVKMRLFLQNLWIQEKEWDDQLKRGHWNMAKSHEGTIYHFCTEAYGRWKSITSLICDASEKAYATAINLNTLYEGKDDANLLFSKSRIAPKQKMSILRLELLALLIGMRSLKFVSKELKLENTKIIVWTDSQCVLNWIKIKKPLSVFVRNRLTEITS